MAILNPSFEDAGGEPGTAEHWTLATSVAGQRIAGFGPSPHRGWEDFDRWFELRLSFVPGSLALAFFDPIAEGFEDFEEAWNLAKEGTALKVMLHTDDSASESAGVDRGDADPNETIPRAANS